MTNGLAPRVCLACLLGLVVLMIGSCIYVEGEGFVTTDFGDSSDANVRAERQVELSGPLPPGSTFSAQTNDGSITFDGQETDECRVVATIRTRATTEEKAWELAEQIDVRLEPSSRGLAVVVDRPEVIRNASFGVSLEVIAPRQANLELVTNDGSVHVRNVQGMISAATSDGNIDAGNIEGDMVLKTSDGSIRLDHIGAERIEVRTSDGSIRGEGISVANLICHTSDGSIDLTLAPDAPRAPHIEMTTSDGAITLVTPPGLSATIDAAASDGSVHTDLPLTLSGRVGRSLRATAGAGEGQIRLRTSDGSITIR